MNERPNKWITNLLLNRVIWLIRFCLFLFLVNEVWLRFTIVFARKNSPGSESLERGRLEHTPFNRHETVSTIAHSEPQQFRIIHPDGYTPTIIRDVCRNNDVRADRAYSLAAAGERVCLRVSRTHRFCISISKQKVREGRWNNPATRREARSFRGLPGEWNADGLDGYWISGRQFYQII